MNKNSSVENPYIAAQMEIAQRRIENQESVDTPAYNLMARVAQPEKFFAQLEKTVRKDQLRILDEVREKLVGSGVYLSNNTRPRKTDD